MGIFVTYLGELSALFSELTNTKRANEDRLRQINDLDAKFNIGPELVEKLLQYFEQNQTSFDKSSSEDMGNLFKLLPATLKIQLQKFLHKDSIEAVPFL